MLEKLQLLLLIIVANGTPILLDDLLGRRWAWPLDAGRVFADGRRLLGRSVTVRGVVVALVATAAVAVLSGHSAGAGLLIGLMAMLGDAGSSFVKRRLGLAPGDKALGLDQIPESLLPLLAVKGGYGLGWWDLALLVLAFVLFDILVSRILYRLHLRKRPH
ncbi:MAG: CDP-archaeol synthase [Pseudomonadota bacterium]|nr:CDP-archaeol synthase [Pseudomonadota bacterium]